MTRPGYVYVPHQRAAHRNQVLDILTKAAVAGQRCPSNTELDLNRNRELVPELARLGLLRIEVYGRNWRVVTILTGPHAGAMTAPPPFVNIGPYRTIGGGEPRRRGEWTNEKWQRARQLRAEGWQLADIAVEIGLSRSAIGLRLQREPVTLPPRTTTSTFKLVPSRGQYMPDEVAEERNRRAELQARDLTGYLLGDPLPGYSALDRKDR